MGIILTNTDAEALLLDIRVAISARQARVRHQAGAFLVFPTSVVVERPGRGQLVFPLRVDIEPGALCHDDGRATVEGVIDGVEVSGSFSWVLGTNTSTRPVPPAGYRFRQRGCEVPRPAWADQLPASRRLVRRTPALLQQDRRRLIRQGRLAEYWLLHLTRRFFERTCEGPLGRAVEARTHVDMDDLAQRGLIVATRLLPLYASPERPPCSWIRMLQLDARRDMFRELGKLDWLPHELGDVLSRAEAAGIEPDPDPSITLGMLLESAVTAGQPLPQASIHGVQRAFAAPRLVSLDTLDVQDLDVPDRDVMGELSDAGSVPGVVAAAVARLVSKKPELTALAFLGEPAALVTVASHVLRALRQRREPASVTRRRCRQDFLASGRLFSSPLGALRFGALAGADRLAAIDAALGATIGVEPSAPGTSPAG